MFFNRIADTKRSDQFRLIAAHILSLQIERIVKLSNTPIAITLCAIKASLYLLKGKLCCQTELTVGVLPIEISSIQKQSFT